MIIATVILWLLAAAATWWLLARRPLPAPAASPGDPYAAHVAEFRREMHDWDRR